jgi:hypothetical protein
MSEEAIRVVQLERTNRGRWFMAGVIVALVLSCCCAPLAVAGIWFAAGDQAAWSAQALQEQLEVGVAAEVWANEPEHANGADADVIAEAVVAQLPDYLTAEDLEALIAGLSVECTIPDSIECCRECDEVEARVPVSTTVTVDCEDIYLDNNEEKLIPAGHVIHGDVKVKLTDGTYKPLFDDIEKTGHIVVINVDTWVQAPWGADASCTPLDDVIVAMISDGCGGTGGCNRAQVWYWPEDYFEWYPEGSATTSTESATTTDDDEEDLESNQSEQPETNAPTEYVLNKGERWLMPQGWLLTGDVSVCDGPDGPCRFPFSSEGDAAGHIVVAKTDVWIEATYGGAWASNSISEEDAEAALMDHGCLSGCLTVEFYWAN